MDEVLITRVEGQKIVREANKWEGTPYVSGGVSKSGADCSGSTWAIYRDAGFFYEISYRPSAEFPHNPHFRNIPDAKPQEGDVGWWNGHVAIYAGDETIWTAHRPGGAKYSCDSLADWIKSKKGVQPIWFRYCGSLRVS